MAKGYMRTGKQARPKTTMRGKRYRCASCHVRSPKPVKTAAPWYCRKCRGEPEVNATPAIAQDDQDAS